MGTTEGFCGKVSISSSVGAFKNGIGLCEQLSKCILVVFKVSFKVSRPRYNQSQFIGSFVYAFCLCCCLNNSQSIVRHWSQRTA